ncbi:hypothetical protein CN899_25430 [Bacillus thuringiensis]|uniref:Integrase catalytic domain-containing protein n=1 Tax=Bacillus thuringiensis TaxID=1428 RepID=A0A9X7GGW7_BACTU|nr:hypothetical protein CN899_25430 [Bacillus thuringiensis]
MDLYSRKIVGWHADRGSHYASNASQYQLQQYGMACSRSRKGNCYDNACIESFHGFF